MSYSIEREDHFDFLSAEYAALHAASSATAFQDGVWLHRLYAVLVPARNAHPVVVTVRREADRELVLVLPLVRTGRAVLTLTFADLGVADYNAAVASGAALMELGRRPEVVAGIRRALGRFDLLRVDRVAGPPQATAALFGGALVHRHRYDTHVMTLESTPEAWRETLDAAFVRHLERKYKRLRPKGERTLRVVTDVAEVAPLMLRLRAFRAARFAERGGVDLVQDDATYAFYRAVAEDSVRRGGPARLAVLEVAGDPVAIALDLVEPDRELFLLVGYDVERLRNYSLGLLIVDGLVQDAIRRGKSYFDLTVGDESYKSDFAARPLPLHQVRIPRTVPGRAAMVLDDGVLAARRIAKRALLAWKARRARKPAGVVRPGGTVGSEPSAQPQTQ
ncbi:GNAT family N-acetyltransferase [Arthrobacter pityocampae]|uniref:GNAT family N-acetyltransferase n=1 Tax=Arthrobacter pityocampae TaxID=547334 RepID=UPI0037368912